MDGLINRSLGQYTIIEPIRQGGMSTVYKAYQESLDRYVAIKVLAYNSDPQFVARFKREARAIAQLQHPNILPIYDSNEQDGMLYLVMQYIENGTTLADVLDQPMESGRALRLIGKVLDALSYAHERGQFMRAECRWNDAARTLTIARDAAGRLPLPDMVRVELTGGESRELKLGPSGASVKF